MDNTPSFGTGGKLLGAPASAVMGMPNALQQQSPSSLGYQPGVLPPPPNQAPQPPMPQAPQMQSMGAPGPISQPMSTPAQNVVGTPPGVPETMKIIDALISRQKLLGKHEEAVRNTMFPQQPQAGL